jgi:hypothetical protein
MLFFTRTRSGNPKAKRKKNEEGKTHKPKPEEQEDMPHMPGDKDPTYHEEQQKYAGGILAAHPPKTIERKHK